MKNLLLKFVLFLTAMQMFAITLPEGTEARVTDIEQEGDIILGVQLAEATVINTPIGKMLVGGPVLFYPNGNVAVCFLATNTKIHTNIGDMALGYGKDQSYRVEFYESGSAKQFAIVDNYTDAKGKKVPFLSKVSTGFGDVILKLDATVYFYDSGSPDKFQLMDFFIDPEKNDNLTYTCDAGSFKIRKGGWLSGYICYHQEKSGKIKTIYTTDKSYKIKTPLGNTFGQGEDNPIKFREDGSLFGFTTGELIIATIAGMKVNIPAGEYLTFYPNGNVCDFTSSSKLTVDIGGKKIEFEDHSKFRASEDGKKIITTPTFSFKRSDGKVFEKSAYDIVEAFYDDGTPKKFNWYDRNGEDSPKWIDNGVRYYVDCNTRGGDDCLSCAPIYYDEYDNALRTASYSYMKKYFLQKGDKTSDVGMVYFAKDGTPSTYALYKVDAEGKRILDNAGQPIVDEANKKKFTKVEKF